MRKHVAVALPILVLSLAASLAQKVALEPYELAQEAATEPYSNDDAYQIYSFLLPSEESVRFAKGTLIIQEDTVTKRDPAACLSPAATNEFKDAIVDFQRVNKKRWRLKRQFESEKTYEIVSEETLKVVFENGWWGAFNKRYPESGGYIVFSAVGFNKDKTSALVFSGSSCGSESGEWSLHLLKKLDGKWRLTPGVTCATVS